MKEFHIFYAPDLQAPGGRLPDEEAGHISRVLRMKEGDELFVADGHGNLHRCLLTLATKKYCEVQVIGTEQLPNHWQSPIHLCVAPTKNMDRMEWLAEKATEIGLDSLTFIRSANSERTVVKTERIEKILVSAMKQSHKAVKPLLVGMTPFDELISQPFDGQRFIAHCYDEADITNDNNATSKAADITTNNNITSKAADINATATHETAKPHLLDVVAPDRPTQVLIGPEGDFSIDEVRRALAAGFQPISLGLSRLRTETAALAAVHIMALKKK